MLCCMSLLEHQQKKYDRTQAAVSCAMRVIHIVKQHDAYSQVGKLLRWGKPCMGRQTPCMCPAQWEQSQDSGYGKCQGTDGGQPAVA